MSQALRKLEERLGVALVQRSTRSVRLTEAGERLYASVRPALAEVRSVVAALGEMSTEPRGTLRLHVSPVANAFLAGPFLAGFLADHPRVTLDVATSDALVDIVAEGYDTHHRPGADRRAGARRGGPNDGLRVPGARRRCAR